jgi:hypothetical protein
LNFLRALCVQNRVTMPRNQDLVCERLVRRYPELLVRLIVRSPHVSFPCSSSV